MSIQLICDDRERAVIPFLRLINNIDIQLVVKRITTSDYAIMFHDKIIMAIERKSWSDLSASIKDGRKENVVKLLELREQTGCTLFYLIEGAARFKGKKIIARMPVANMQAHLDHLTMRDNIHIIFSLNEEDTAKRLHELIKNFLSLKSDVIQRFLGAAVNIPTELTRAWPADDKKIIYDIWCSIPYVSPKTATILIDKYHIADFLLGNITTAELYVLTYTNGTIIGKRANLITNAQQLDDEKNNKIYINMIACVPRITKKTAELILNTIKLRDILENRTSKEVISAIPKGIKSTVGPAAAENILRFFIK
jgi:ERCC4-type nuclease